MDPPVTSGLSSSPPLMTSIITFLWSDSVESLHLAMTPADLSVVVPFRYPLQADPLSSMLKKRLVVKPNESVIISSLSLNGAKMALNPPANGSAWCDSPSPSCIGAQPKPSGNGSLLPIGTPLPSSLTPIANMLCVPSVV